MLNFDFYNPTRIAFGKGKVSALMGEVGKGITAFKKGVNDGTKEIETETAEAAKDVTPAEKDKVYIDAGVLLAEEVAVCRFKARGFSAETQIDLEAREEMLDAELELAKNKAGEDPLEAQMALAQAAPPKGQQQLPGMKAKPAPKDE